LKGKKQPLDSSTYVEQSALERLINIQNTIKRSW
jgi:hypothetical protein